MDTQTTPTEVQAQHWTKIIDEFKVNAAREYPHEFIDTLADNAYSTLFEWLQRYNVPQQVTDILDSLLILERSARDIEHNALSDTMATFLFENVPATTRLIAELGGKFAGSGLESIPREPVKWPLPFPPFGGPASK